MKIEGDYELAAPRKVVWEAIQDPDVLSRTLPGCEQLEQEGENAFRGALTVQIGPVKGQFRGTVELTDLVPPESYHMKLNGQGPAGFMNGEGEIRLEEMGDATRLHYAINAQVGGRIAGVGQRLLDSSAKVVTRQGLEGLAAQVAARAAASGEGDAAQPVVEAPPAPTQAEFAAKVAKGVAEEMIPKSSRPWILLLGLGVVAVVAILVLRGCS